MIALFLASAILFGLVVMIAIELGRMRASRRTPVQTGSRHPRRQPLLEERMRDAFAGPVEKYGEIFVSYMVWRRQQTRLELFSADKWLQLSEFTRAIVVRHLWRSLERLAKGSVVIVDSPPQTWSAEIDRRFDDQGIDPWPLALPGASQFVKDG